MFSVSRRFVRAMPIGRRMMSGGHSEAEAKAEVDRWYKITLGKLKNIRTLRIFTVS